MTLVEPPPPSDDEVRMARFAAGQLSPDGAARYEEFTDRSGEHSLDVLTCPDAPARGLHTVTTLTLHRSPNVLGAGTPQETDVRVELVTVLAADDPALVTALLVASAFAMVGEPWPVEAGTVFPDVVAGLVDADGRSGGGAEHLVFTAPGTFPRLDRYRLTPALDVHWLQAVPIHESERRFLLERGLDALEDALAAAEAEFHDVRRPPVV